MDEKRKDYLYQYARQNLKRVPLDVPKERYEVIKAAAEAAGESVNGYIKRAVYERMEQDMGAEQVEKLLTEAMLNMDKQEATAGQKSPERPATKGRGKRTNRAKAPAEGPHGVDRWTSNGYGLVVGEPSETQKKAVAEYNAEIAARKGTAGDKDSSK
jgi:uncharacterized protein (DUF1778 family)